MLNFASTKVLRLRPSRVTRPLLLFTAGAVALVTALQTARLAAIITLGETAKPWTIETALSLDPENPELHHSLGLIRFYSSPESDAANGLRHLRRATELNPNVALYWLDLASACEANQDATCADRSFQRALELSPMTPRLYWSVANYALRAGQPDKALALFRRLLELDSTYADIVFQVCSRVLDSGNWTQASALNLDPHLRVALVNFLEGNDQPDVADAVWRQFATEQVAAGKLSSPPIAFSAIEPYLDHLIDAGKQREAVAVWNELQTLGVIASAFQQRPADGETDAAHRQYIFNRGFEQTPLNGGFDWRYQSLRFVSVAFSAAAAHSGSRSARIEFTEGRNEESEPIYQRVPVQPGQSYLLTAFVRTEGITSDTGPRLRVLDSRCTACVDATTEPTIGTTPWHQVHVSFTTGPQTSSVKISVWRTCSRAFPFDITGTFWLDDVSLTTAQPDLAPGTLAKAAVPASSEN
jgi:tetratricopeptide (TPR) repeat protein